MFLISFFLKYLFRFFLKSFHSFSFSCWFSGDLFRLCTPVVSMQNLCDILCIMYAAYIVMADTRGFRRWDCSLGCWLAYKFGSIRCIGILPLPPPCWSKKSFHSVVNVSTHLTGWLGLSPPPQFWFDFFPEKTNTPCLVAPLCTGVCTGDPWPLFHLVGQFSRQHLQAKVSSSSNSFPVYFLTSLLISSSFVPLWNNADFLIDANYF